MIYKFTCESCGKEFEKDWTKKRPTVKYCSKKCRYSARLTGEYKPDKPIDPSLHDKIKKIYKDKDNKKAIRDFIKDYGISRYRLNNFALAHKLITEIKGDHKWKEEEIDILTRYKNRSPKYIKQLLNRSGFDRTTTAIKVKKMRMDLNPEINGDSAASLSYCFGVDESTIRKWIKLKYLKVSKNQVEDKNKVSYNIQEKDIKKFIIDYVSMLDFSKIDKFWLVDLLTDGHIIKD